VRGDQRLARLWPRFVFLLERRAEQGVVGWEPGGLFLPNSNLEQLLFWTPIILLHSVFFIAGQLANKLVDNNINRTEGVHNYSLSHSGGGMV
jgi:hypothetical protein